MIKFPYKIQLTMPEKIAKSDMNKAVMGLRPSSYKVHRLNRIQFEWEYKTQSYRDMYLPTIVSLIEKLPINDYEISIVDP